MGLNPTFGWQTEKNAKLALSQGMRISTILHIWNIAYLTLFLLATLSIKLNVLGTIIIGEYLIVSFGDADSKLERCQYLSRKNPKLLFAASC